MKFTLEDVCKELAARLSANGEKLNLSERSIREQSETLIALVANDETELSDFIEKVLPLFKTADSNVRNDVSSAIKDYKEKNPAPKVPDKKDKKDDKDKKDERGDELANALSRIEELEKRLSESDRNSMIANRKSEIISKMGEKGIKDTEWINSLLDEVNLVSEDFDVDARVEKYAVMYNKSKANVKRNITPENPNGGGDDDKRIANTIKAAKAFADSQSLLTNN